MKKYGLIGKNLEYSYSKLIHEWLFSHYMWESEYELICIDRIEKDLLEKYDGLNITIPFKEEIISFLSEKDENVINFSSCNTITKDLKGYNTDIVGFEGTLKDLNISNIQRVVILGSGATSKMVQKYFENIEVIVISRLTYPTYENEELIQGDVLINTSPLGMYPNDEKCLLSKDAISRFSYIIDLNYNPPINKLLNIANELQIPNENGLKMLVIQAVKSFEIWNNIKVDKEVIEELYNYIMGITSKGIAFIGMPFSGKSTLMNKYIQEGLYSKDLDDEIVKKNTKSIHELITKDEKKFREIETNTLQELVDDNVQVIFTGGGVVEDFQNQMILREYQIINLDVPLSTLIDRYNNDPNSRPLIKTTEDLIDLYERRYMKYQYFQNSQRRKNEINDN